MKQNRPWRRLDNAAKIFPPTSSRYDTKVFRFVCELVSPVDSGVLQRALEKTVEEFPLYRSTLKKGLFWYYLEESSQKPEVTEEALPVCTAIYNPDRPGLLFRVSYYGNRINFEIFHALADGNGAMQFFRTLVFNYLSEQSGIEGRLSSYDAARDQRELDAFYKYYDKHDAISKAGHLPAYRVRGERIGGGNMRIFEGFMSAKAVLELAHQNDATLSELLISLFICAIYDGMAVRERVRPVVISVPVDLRRFFTTQTTRNFFGVIHVAHNFKNDGEGFEQVLLNVRSSFSRQLTKANLGGIIARFSAIENKLLVKAVPLVLKIPVLRAAGRLAEKEDTAAFSNLGRVDMPPETAEHIRLFSVFLSTKRPQLCICSFGDMLAISVSSPLRDTGIARRFFRQLTGMGVSVQVTSNIEQFSRGGSDAAL